MLRAAGSEGLGLSHRYELVISPPELARELPVDFFEPAQELLLASDLRSGPAHRLRRDDEAAHRPRHPGHHQQSDCDRPGHPQRLRKIQRPPSLTHGEEVPDDPPGSYTIGTRRETRGPTMPR